MKIIDGKNAILGRLASYVAKESLKGEEVIILNCKEIIVTGSDKDIKKKFEERKRKGGSSQKGPIHIRFSNMIVKRAIRGMLPDYRRGRGRTAYKKVRCYNEPIEELENVKKLMTKGQNIEIINYDALKDKKKTSKDWAF